MSRTSPSENDCAICLDPMDPKGGRALFTAECSHTFHFHCIASNVQHGNRTCPLCLANWNQLPFETTQPQPPPVRGPTGAFQDDEPLDPQPHPAASSSHAELVLKTFLEFPAVQRSATVDNFSVLIHLQAPPSTLDSPRAAVDLVAVLDVSGSMAGSKLSLLKQAMDFVVQNLASHDRLSVITFSSTARREFPLLRMTEAGKARASQAIGALHTKDTTNIAGGLRLGAAVLESRRQRNAVSSIILLSDGQDNCELSGSQFHGYNLSLLPPSITDRSVPVHAFGFGTDHDAALMSSIAEVSGGTFSFVEKPEMIKVAFAQCIGGLLSVVAQELRVEMECVEPDVHMNTITSGGYRSQLTDGGRRGSIVLGDLYAYEQRDLLVSVNVPPEASHLLTLRCRYIHAVSKSSVELNEKEVKLPRPEEVKPEERVASAEVERQKRRFSVTATVAAARDAADEGRLEEARSALALCRAELEVARISENWSDIDESMGNELEAMQGMMGDNATYGSRGKAYMSSNIATHGMQRASARSSSNLDARRRGSEKLVVDYQSPVMTEMVRRAQQTPAEGDHHSSTASPPSREENRESDESSELKPRRRSRFSRFPSSFSQSMSGKSHH